MEFFLVRSPVEALLVMSEIENEMSSAVAVSGHEISGSHFSIYFHSAEQQATRCLTAIEARYLRPSESVVLRREVFDELPSSRRNGVEVFDVFAIPLPPGGYSYAQNLGYINAFQADAVKVFDLISLKELVDLKTVSRTSERFPPVLTLLSVARKKCGWRKLGNIPYEGNELRFRQSNSAAVCGSGIFCDWRLWTSKSGWKDVGALPPSDRNVEMGVTWSPMAIVDRILTGRHLYEECL